MEEDEKIQFLLHKTCDDKKICCRGGPSRNFWYGIDALEKNP